MIPKYLFITLSLFTTSYAMFSQDTYTCSVSEGTVIQNFREQILDSHFLGSTPDGSTMRYCSDFFTLDYGGSYTLDYIDQGGTGMDAYPNIIIGSAKISGNWIPGNETITGMPVQLSNIPEGMYLEWKVSQQNALDPDDKWMASINFIFDNYGTATSEPVSDDRDYDLVVKATSHNFNGDELDDQPTANGNNPAFWFFARETNGDIKPYVITIEGITYTYAVRYKFFEGSASNANKSHVKFIPYGPNGAPPVLILNIDDVITASRDYIAFANLPTAQYNLAQNNIGLPDAWLKSINAGYEVYTGESTLKIEKFKVYPDATLNVDDITDSNPSFSIYPNPASTNLTINFGSPEHRTVTIYNSLGQEVARVETHEEATQLDTSSFSSGMYIVKISDELKSKDNFKKILVKR